MRYIVLVIVFVLSACKQSESKQPINLESNVASSALAKQNVVDVVNFEALQPLLEKKDGKTYVVNFWATWCVPCVKELPYFETINKAYSKHNVEVLLVSLDFPDVYEKRLLPFIAKKKLQSKIILLDDGDANTWIPKVDKNWSGAIPATLIYNTDKRQFYETSFTLEELKTEVDKFLK